MACLPFAASAAKAKKSDPKAPVVVIKTSEGEIRVQLDAEKAPITTKNFLTYVDKKFYDGTIFHRVIDGFMIQGGGLTKDLDEKTTREPIKNESRNGLQNLRGAIAMARTNDPDSATSQFFINVQNNAGLDYPNNNGGYAVFGHVIAGMDVVDKIKSVPTTTTGGMANVPVTPIVIMSVRRAE
jgi:peptidyl-prolyl cis-trans isomerase A (cyclophilin A)